MEDELALEEEAGGVPALSPAEMRADESWIDVLELRATPPWQLASAASETAARLEPDWSVALRRRGDRASKALKVMATQELAAARRDFGDDDTAKPKTSTTAQGAVLTHTHTTRPARLCSRKTSRAFVSPRGSTDVLFLPELWSGAFLETMHLGDTPFSTRDERRAPQVPPFCDASFDFGGSVVESCLFSIVIGSALLDEKNLLEEAS